MQNQDIFLHIKNTLQNDLSLSNFLKYIDYGNFKENTSVGDVRWETLPCELNVSNHENKTQCVRLVSKIDSKFLNTLSKFLNNARYNSTEYYNCSVYDFIHRYKDSYSITSTSQVFKYLIDNSINIKYDFCVKGTSLTLLDFIGKNPRNTNVEIQYWKNLYLHINKMIFVGDKCFLLAIIDSNNNIYMSVKNLELFYKLDNSDNKTDFTNIVKSFFVYASKYCYKYTNLSITHLVNNEIIYPSIKNIQNNNCLKSIIGKETDYINIDDFDFVEDKKTDDYIKKNIECIITSAVKKILCKKYNFDNLDINSIISTVKTKMKDYYQDSIKKSFNNGFNFYNTICKCGWNILDIDNNKCDYHLCFNYEHNYLYKDVEIIPNRAFIYESDASRNYISQYRELNDAGLKYIKTKFCIKKLYLDITNGTMMCEGYHPNVSSGHQVCMGDLKGKICFDNCSSDDIISQLNSCEQLLTSINYTSAYRDDGKSYFTCNDYSHDVGNDNNLSKAEKNSAKNSIKECTYIESDDFEEESTLNNENTNQELDSDTNISEDDFEEI